MPDMESHTFGDSRYIQTTDGRQLHYMEQGTGKITVVFESGMGMSRSSWGLVQPLVTEHTRAVVYDRAGLGRSEPDRTPRTLNRIANDLTFLLKQLGAGPFILVGHSWGGPIVRSVAAMNPALIRWLVLVDQTDEHCGLYFKESSVQHFARMNKLLPLLARTGLYRLMGSKPGKVLPADVYKNHLRNSNLPDGTEVPAGASGGSPADCSDNCGRPFGRSSAIRAYDHVLGAPSDRRRD